MNIYLSKEQVKWIYGALELELANNEFGQDIINYLESSYDKEEDIKEYIAFTKLCRKFGLLNEQQEKERLDEVKSILKEFKGDD